jgi:hypothetical protein
VLYLSIWLPGCNINKRIQWKKIISYKQIAKANNKYPKYIVYETKGQSASVYRRTDNTMAKWKVQKDKQRSTKHTYQTKDRVTRTSLKTGGELRCSGRIGSSCSTSGTCHVNLLTHPVISREWGKDREVFATSGTEPWSLVTQIFLNDQPSHGGDRNIFEVMTWTLPKGTLGSVASLLAATLYQGNPDGNHKLWNIVSSERYILHMQVLYMNGKFTIGKLKSSLLS